MTLSGSSQGESPTVVPNGSDRDPVTGRFVAGNAASVKTTLQAARAQLPARFTACEDDARAFLEASITDDGGRNELPARRLSQHSYRALLHKQILRLDVALEAHGLFDRRGKLRVLWLSKLESLMREARSFDAALGLARRTKQVPSLDHYLNQTYTPEPE